MWSNWSGSQNSDAPLHHPAGGEAIARLMRDTSGPLRPVGTGHSFTPLVPGAAQIAAPQPAPGPAVHAVTGSVARVEANATLRDLSQALGAEGRAFRNLGDINVQTLAGATSTATHGTGATLPCLAAELRGIELVTATGEVVQITHEDLPGAQVALGLLGVITRCDIETVPSYNLRRQVQVREQDDLIAGMHDKWQAHRHYEFFLLPHSGKGIAAAHDISTDLPGKAPLDLDEWGVAYLRAASALRHIHPALRRAAIRMLAAVLSDEDYVGDSWQVLCATRNTRFNEMEYHLPPDTARDVLQEVLTLIDRRHPDVWFPIEVRQTGGDSAWLSPFQHAPRVSVAVHMHARQVYEAYFRDCEAIFRAAGGRPHWGKLHGLTRADIETLYPDLPKFDALRARLDPQDRLLNPALAHLFRP